MDEAWLMGILGAQPLTSEFGLPKFACQGSAPDPPSVSTDFFSDYMSSFSQSKKASRVISPRKQASRFSFASSAH